MSAGHHLSDWSAASSAKVDKVLNDPAVQRYRQRFARDNSEHDLPYLAGYSTDGCTIYFDRHLPEFLEAIDDDGKKYLFRPREFVRLHEETEKSIIDALGWHYLNAHEIANGAERRAVVSAGIPWRAYRKAVDKYIKADEIEKLKTVPADLDMRPYFARPVNRKLIARMHKAMGQEKLEKTDPKVNYSDDRGTPSRHCGPDAGWTRNYCEYFGDCDCKEVIGYIDPRGGCDLYEKAGAKTEAAE